MIIRADFDEYYIKDLNEYNSTIQTLVDEHPEIYFRGVNQARFNLSPSISRKQPKRFTLLNEQELFEAFRRRIAVYKGETYREYTSTKAQIDIETLAIAQHHGLKTRLLDWSTNPLASLWFACEQPKDDPKPDSYCIVWILIAPTDKEYRNKYFKRGEDFINIFIETETFVYVPNIVNPRIKNQSGLFSIHHFDKRYIPLDENETFFPHRFNSILRYDPAKNWELIKIMINRELYGKNILNNLRRFDVHEETIYPSLESLGKRLNFDYESGLVL